MKRIYVWCLVIGLVAWVVGVPCFCLEVVQPKAAAEETTSTATTILNALWAFLNSNLGVTGVVATLAWFFKNLFLWKPEWKVVFDKYHPLILQAVKYAEKQIPDDTPNAGLARFDAALRWLEQVDSQITDNHSAQAVRMAINATHAQAEANENI